MSGRVTPYLVAAAAGAGVSLVMSAQAPLLRAAPMLAITGAVALAAALAGPRAALALLVIAAFFPVPLRVAGAVVGPPDLAALLVLAVWAGRMAMRGRVLIPRTAGDWGLSVLIAATAASTAAVAVSDGPVPLGASLRKVIQLAVLFAGTYYFAAESAGPGGPARSAGRGGTRPLPARAPRPAGAPHREVLRFAVCVFLGFSALQGAYAALLQFAPAQLGMTGLWLPHLAERASARAMGTVDASFGHYMAAAFVLALATAVSEEGRGGRAGGRIGGADVRSALPAPFILAGIVSSGTRGSLAAVGAGLLVLLAFSRRRLALLAYLGALAAMVGLAGLLWPQVAHPRQIVGLFTAHGSSDLAIRLLSWRIGWELAIQHPWLGVGPGANAITIEALLGSPAAALRYVEGTMNAYLQAFLETGVVGLVGLVAFVALCAGAGIGRGRRGDHLALGLAAALVALATTGLSGPLLIGGIGHLLFLLAGLTAAACPPQPVAAAGDSA